MATRHKTVDPNVKLSKALSWLLRHGAEKEGFTFLKGGFLYLEDILKHPKFQHSSVADIQKVVETNEKQRFGLETDEESGKLKIRANQGHSLQVDDLDLTPIEQYDKFPTVIHGTNKKAIQFISKEGLKKMNRNHIHFAVGEPGENGVISGMRQSCSVIIYINLKKALEDGFKFFQSANGVILCPGNEEGVLPNTYFDKVIERTTRKKIPFDKVKGEPSQQECTSVSNQALLDVTEHSAQNATVSADDLANEFEGQRSKGKKKNKS